MPQLPYETTTEYVIRCPFCGDSRNPMNGHFYINKQSGLYHCKKCESKGKVNYWFFDKNNIPIFGQYDLTYQEKDQETPEITGHHSYSNRPSMLPLKSMKFRGEYWDGLQTVNAYGLQMGYMLRQTKPIKKSHIIGDTGIAYPYQEFGLLKSSSDNPIVCVEGFYDVLGKNDVAFFGFLSKTRIENYLRGHHIILQPDGDVWVNKPKYMINVVKSFYRSKNNYLVGINVLPPNMDIDEIDNQDLLFISRCDILDFILKLESML